MSLNELNVTVPLQEIRTRHEPIICEGDLIVCTIEPSYVSRDSTIDINGEETDAKIIITETNIDNSVSRLQPTPPIRLTNLQVTGSITITIVILVSLILICLIVFFAMRSVPQHGSDYLT